jgi:hypothetical protein
VFSLEGLAVEKHIEEAGKALRADGQIRGSRILRSGLTRGWAGRVRLLTLQIISFGRLYFS